MSSVSSGANEKIERVRKSSGMVLGGEVARLDTVWAAVFRARNEDVRFERNDDFRLFWLGGDFGGVGSTRISSCIGNNGSNILRCSRG